LGGVKKTQSGNRGGQTELGVQCPRYRQGNEKIRKEREGEEKLGLRFARKFFIDGEQIKLGH